MARNMAAIQFKNTIQENVFFRTGRAQSENSVWNKIPAETQGFIKQALIGNLGAMDGLTDQ